MLRGPGPKRPRRESSHAPKKISREVLSPKDPQILRDPMEAYPDVSGGLLTLRSH